MVTATEIITKLKELKSIGITITQIEQAVNFPKNNLNKYLAGTFPLPGKWIIPFSAYIQTKHKEMPAIFGETAIPADQEVQKTQVPVIPQAEIKADPVRDKKQSNIKKKIEEIKSEKIPDHRNTTNGRKVWNSDQQKRIKELEKLL